MKKEEGGLLNLEEKRGPAHLDRVAGKTELGETEAAQCKGEKRGIRLYL